MAQLSQLEWPGNIRQLENAVYRAVVMSDTDQLGLLGLSARRRAIDGSPVPDAPHSEALMVEPAFHSTAPAMVSGNEIPIAPLPSAGTLEHADEWRRGAAARRARERGIRFAISHYRGQMFEGRVPIENRPLDVLPQARRRSRRRSGARRRAAGELIPWDCGGRVSTTKWLNNGHSIVLNRGLAVTHKGKRMCQKRAIVAKGSL